MTIRWRLNLSVAALIVVFLLAGGVAVRAVRHSAEHAHAYGRLRQSAEFTSDLRTAVFQQVAIEAGLITPSLGHDVEEFARFWIEDIDVQIHHTRSATERQHWSRVRELVAETGRRFGPALDSGGRDALIQQTEKALRTLRYFYDTEQADSVRRVASTAFHAQVAVGIACALAVVLFLIYFIMVRHWLVKPIEVLKQGADELGRANHDDRIPLTGTDELAQLARRMEATASRLAKQQHELAESRALSAIGELCTSVAHGLRNPLAALRASAQLAQRRMKDVAPGQALAGDVLKQVDRMDERITKLFEFSRPADLRKQPTTFGELAQAVQTEVSPFVREQGMTLAIEDRSENEPCLIDGEYLAGSISELVVNAVRHSAAGAAITLRGQVGPHVGAAGSTRLLQVEVIDRGPGMSPVTIDKAFNLFFTSHPDGTGMGLAMVKRAVERHGGEISISSEPGQGTTVALRVPMNGTST